MDMLDNGLGQSHPIIGSRSPAQLVKEDERILTGQTDCLVGLHHLHHKGGLAADQVIRCPDAGKDGIENRQLCPVSWNVGTHLGHDDDNGQLTHIGGLSAHVGASNQLHIGLAIQIDGVGNVRLSPHDLLHYRMAALFNGDGLTIGEAWSHQMLVFSNHCEGLEDIDSREGLGQRLEPADVFFHLLADAHEDFVFQIGGFIPRFQHLALNFGQFFRAIAF